MKRCTLVTAMPHPFHRRAFIQNPPNMLQNHAIKFVKTKFVIEVYDLGWLKKLMAPRTDRTTRIPSGVASLVTTKHAAEGSVIVN